MPSFAVHPGEILKAEFMEPLELTSYRVAHDLGVSVPRIHDIVLGKRAITADTALRLSIYFGNSAQFWLNLQNDYELRLARKPGLSRIKPFNSAA